MIKSRIKEKGGSEMMKFDNAKYRTVLNLIKKTGEFKGKAVPSKARLHEMIGDALGILLYYVISQVRRQSSHKALPYWVLLSP